MVIAFLILSVLGASVPQDPNAPSTNPHAVSGPSSSNQGSSAPSSTYQGSNNHGPDNQGPDGQGPGDHGPGDHGPGVQLWEQGGVQAPQQPQTVSSARYTSVETKLAGKLVNPIGNYPSRISQLVGVRGLEDNVVFGVGLVVGLAGTGDSIDAAKRLLQNVLLTRNVHVEIQELASKNVAIVQVEARLPAGLKPGRKLDVTVSTIGDATSLVGGTLIFTELSDPSGRFVYATASGPVNTGGFQASGASASAKRNQTTVAILPEGGKVEREVPTSIVSDNGFVYLDLKLERMGLGNAMHIASSVNQIYPGTAIALPDGRSIEVHVPADLPANDIVPFVHGILAREVDVEVAPRVVLNERSGTIVLGGDVRLRAGAIAHGSITVTISESPVASQPGPLSNGQTVVTPRTSLDVAEEPGKLVMIPGAVTLREVVEVLDVLGATPRELVSIIEAMAQGGLLEAEIREDVMDGIRLNLPAMDITRALAPTTPPSSSLATNAPQGTTQGTPPGIDGDTLPAARRFQALLGAMLVKEMRSTLPEGFFGGGAGGDVYGGWLDEHVGASLAQRDSLHLESVVRESLQRKAQQMEKKP